jgi:hypothetical protein
VAVRDDVDDETVVQTTCWPDPALWDFQRRRKKSR